MVSIDVGARVSRISLKIPVQAQTDLELGASVAVNGCCLTVADINEADVKFDVVSATQQTSNLGSLRIGDKVNIERSLKFGDEIGGHVLSGHIATTAEILDYQANQGEAKLSFQIPNEFRKYLMLKGFVALNGASLTLAAYDRETGIGEINLIPETLSRTNLGMLSPGDHLNLEIDSTTQTIVDTVERLHQQQMSDVKPN